MIGVSIKHLVVCQFQHRDGISQKEFTAVPHCLRLPWTAKKTESGLGSGVPRPEGVAQIPSEGIVPPPCTSQILIYGSSAPPQVTEAPDLDIRPLKLADF